MTFDRLKKNGIRQWILSQKIGPAKTALFLPGEECLDLKLALEKGLINSDTFIIASEGVKAKRLPIIRFLDNNFKNYYLHRAGITSLDICDLTSAMGKLDFAFLDFCGDFLAEFEVWHECLICSSHQDAVLAYTFRAFSRGNDYIESCKDEIKQLTTGYLASTFALKRLTELETLQVNEFRDYCDKTPMISILANPVNNDYGCPCTIKEHKRTYVKQGWFSVPHHKVSQW